MVVGQIGVRVVKLLFGVDCLLDIVSFSVLIILCSWVLVIGQMFNVIGGCLDLVQVICFVYVVGMVVMVDGVQGVVYFFVDVQVLDIDFYVFFGYKLYGLIGIGVLYGKSELLVVMLFWFGGGKMIVEVSFDGFMLQLVFYGFEVGMLNVVGVIGFSVVLEWLVQSDIGQVENWSCSLVSLVEEELVKWLGFCFFCCQQLSLLVFEFEDIYYSDLVMLLVEFGIVLCVG